MPVDQFDELIVKRMENLSKRAEALTSRGKQLPPVLKANTDELLVIAADFGSMVEEIQVVIEEIEDVKIRLALAAPPNPDVRRLELEIAEVILPYSQSLKTKLINAQQNIKQMCSALDRVSAILEARAKEQTRAAVEIAKHSPSAANMVEIYNKINLRQDATTEHQTLTSTSGGSEIE